MFAIAFEISLLQEPERQYQSFEKVQARKVFQGRAFHSQNAQLNDSFASFVRSVLSAKKANRFQIIVPHPAVKQVKDLLKVKS